MPFLWFFNGVSSLERVPAAGNQRPFASVFFTHHHVWPLRDSSNRRDHYSSQSLWQDLCLVRRYREQQLVIVAPMQGQFEWIQTILARNIPVSCLGDSCAFQPSADAAGGA